jgi:uncharacterized protein
MADLRYQTRAGAQGRAEIDQGLRSYMLGVYNYMALGIAVTAAIVLASFTVPAVNAVVSALYWPAFLGMLAIGFFGAGMILNSRSIGVAHLAYWAYVACWGVGIAPLVNHYLRVDPQVVMTAFLSAALLFGGMSLWGYTAKKDLSGMGRFAMMALFGIFAVGIANLLVGLFMGFSSINLGISLLVSAGFVLFVSLITAWETQMVKSMYYAGDAGETASRKSIFGAFALYGSFVSIFANLLQLMGFLGGGDE